MVRRNGQLKSRPRRSERVSGRREAGAFVGDKMLCLYMLSLDTIELRGYRRDDDSFRN